VSNARLAAMICGVVAVTFAAVGWAAPRSYTCHRASASITIDGALDDAGWQGIPWVDSFQRFMAPSGGTPQRTGVKAAWDDRNLYIAFRMWDANPWATKAARDDSLWEEQVVEVYIDENGDLLNYKEFEINPLGTVIDLLIPKAGDQADWRKCAQWNAAGWRTAVRVYREAPHPYCEASGTTESGPKLLRRGSPSPISTRQPTSVARRPLWAAEMAFPWGIFSEATHRPPQVGDVWRIQFYRIERPRPGADLVASSWSPTPDFHVPEYFGRLEFAE
jgi:hypothetical protein